MHRRLLSVLAAAGIATAAVLVAGGAAAALTPDRYGFAYLDDETPAGAYVPDLSRQWISTGIPNTTVTALGPVGIYRVRFPGIAAPGGIAHVTAVNRTGAWCQVDNYGPAGADELVDVRCYRAGVLVDTRFTILFTTSSAPPPPGGGAYAYVRSGPGGGIISTYNSAGAGNTVTPLGGGTYQVRLFGVGAGPTLVGGLQVTAANGATAARCKVAGWVPAAFGQDVLVRCHNPAGVAAPAGWTLSYQHRRAITGGIAPPNRFGYIFDLGGGPGTVHNSLGGAVATAGAGLGLRSVSFAAIGLPQDHLQVTAYGPGPEFCTMAQPWTVAGGTVTLKFVVCYTATGALSTQPSLVTYTSRA